MTKPAPKAFIVANLPTKAQLEAAYAATSFECSFNLAGAGASFVFSTAALCVASSHPWLAVFSLSAFTYFSGKALQGRNKLHKLEGLMARTRQTQIEGELVEDEITPTEAPARPAEPQIILLKNPPLSLPAAANPRQRSASGYNAKGTYTRAPKVTGRLIEMRR